MSLAYRAHEPCMVGDANANYRTGVREDCTKGEKVRFPLVAKMAHTVMLTKMYALQTSSSSSSSSPSGAATPVDDTAPERIAFPRVATHTTHGLRSISPSSLSLDQQRPPLKTALKFTPRPPKLSLDTSKVKPTPALPSASIESPLGAFCPTSSAESHLRYLVNYSRVESPPTASTTPSRHSHKALDRSSCHSISSHETSEAKFPFATSPSLRRLRTSSFRSLSFSWSSADKEPSPYDVNDDTEDDHEAQETFWPRRKLKSAMRKKVPSICRSPSAPSDDDSIGPSPRYPAPLISPPQLSRLRASSKTPSSSFSTAVASSSKPLPDLHRPNMHVRSSTTSLLPPNPSRSGKSSKNFLYSGNASGAGSSELNSTLAAVESASRLRSRCACGVCGKVGSDYPRCPRCSATWCSRQCRVSEAGGGKHVCRR